MIKVYFFVILTVFASQSSIGQSFTTFNYSLEEGLPSSEVYQVYQDKAGFIWFATDNGIVRFDGKEMQTYHIKDGLSDPVVFGFQEDDKGRIWLKSFSGKLSYIENSKIKKYEYNDKIEEVVKYGIPTFNYSSDLNEVKIFSARNFGSIDSTGRVEVKKVKNEGLYYYGTIDKGVWGLTNIDLSSYSIYINDKEYPVKLSQEPYHLQTYSVPARIIRWHNKLFLTIKNNLYSYDNEKVSRVFVGKAPIISLSVDKNDHLWIGYMGAGLEAYSNEDFSNPSSLSDFNKSSVTSVLSDRDNGFWISTLENGVYYLPNLLIENYSELNYGNVSNVITKGDSIYISNLNGDFFIVNAESKKILWKTKFNSPIDNFYVTKSGMILLFTNITYVFDSSLTLVNKELFAGMNFIENTDGTLWAYGNTRIAKFDRFGKLLFIKRLETLYRSFLITDSLFFLSGKTGLHIRDSNLEIISKPKDLEDYKISGLISLNDSLILMNTQGSGFLLLNRIRMDFKKFDKNNSFIANNIYTSLIKDGTMWMGTDAGLIGLKVNGLISGTIDFNKWDYKYGLVGKDIKYLAITKNTIWAFSDKGYSIIPNQLLKQNESLPFPYLKQVQLNDTHYDFTTRKFELPHNKTNITIQIGYLSFQNQNVISRYRISKNENWTYTNERSIQFNSLAPASYSFDLEYTIDNVNWIPANIPFNFDVNPPWWQLWYFQASALLVVVFLAYLYTRRTIKNYKQKNHFLNVINLQQQKLVKAEIQITERERKRISKELHDGVGTDLAVAKLKVIDIITKKENNELSLRELNEQLNYAITEIKNISYALTPPDLERFGLVIALTTYINKITESIETKIIFSASKMKIPKGEIEIALFRVVQELINNTLKHAQAKSIQISINTSENSLQLLYQDDGIGFSYENVKSGLGLANIDSRIQSIDGKVSFISNGNGTSYRIEIPISNYRPLVEV